MEKPTPEQLKERRAAWVKALRSGKYQQGRRCLTRITSSGEEDCCLGVACKVAIELGAKVEADECYDGMKCYDGGTHGLGRSILRFYGFKSELGLGGYIGGALSDWNDTGKSFSEIADFIESNPPGLWEDSHA